MEAYDIETFKNHVNNHIPYCVCFSFKDQLFDIYYEENSDIILKSIDLIFSLISRKICYYYVHNLNFDGILILNSLADQDKYTFGMFSRELNIYEIKVEYGEKTIIFKCSYKIIPLGLKKISESFNLPPKMPFPYNFISKDRLNFVGTTPDFSFFNSKKEYDDYASSHTNLDVKKYTIEYCKRDVLITREFVIEIKKIASEFGINLDTVKSAPSLSKKIFIKKFNNNRIKYSKNSFIDKFVRPGYFGGNCQVYGNRYDNEKIYHFDFSGMYAQCMMEKFPFGRHISTIESFDLSKPGFYWIEFESDMEYPILPHHSINKKLMFTNGVIVGCYWFEEIQLFIKYGGKVRKILAGIVFSEFNYVFDDFVSYFQNIRIKGGAYKIFSKLCVNSLYGGLGMKSIENHTFFIKKHQRSELESLNLEIVWEKEVNDSILICAGLNYKLKKMLKIGNADLNQNVAIAACITSKARIKLYNAQQAVISNGGRLLYSDTDSIYAAFTRDVKNEKHGDVVWGEDTRDISDGIFMLPKAYGVILSNGEELIKIKGYNQKTLEYLELKRKFLNNESIFLKEYTFLERSNFTLKENKIVKTFDLASYDKRKFIDEKHSTIPYFKKGDGYE